MASSAVLNSVKEGRFLLPGNDRCPADVYLPNWSAGRDAALDITVVNPLQQATVNEAAVTPGHSLNFAYDRKMRGAADDCERQGIVFQPLAFESLGGLAQGSSEGGEENCYGYGKADWEGGERSLQPCYLPPLTAPDEGEIRNPGQPDSLHPPGPN